MYESSYCPSRYWYWSRFGSLNTVWQLVLEKENYEFKTVKSRLKIDLTSHPVRFQTVVMSVLLYSCTTWTITKRLEKKLDKSDWTNPRSSCLQNSCSTTNYQFSFSYIYIYIPILQTMLGVAEEERTNSRSTVCHGCLHRNAQVRAPTSKDLRTSAVCGHWMQSRGSDRNERES